MYYLILLIISCCIYGCSKSAPEQILSHDPASVDFAAEHIPFKVIVKDHDVMLPFIGGVSLAKPVFVDIDGDAAMDIVIGKADGRLWLFRNTGSDASFELDDEPFSNLDVGDASAPCFVDLDGDGDYDLIVGEGDGNLNYFQNSGSATHPDFTIVDEAFADIDVGSSNSVPACADLDNDGDQDLVLGQMSRIPGPFGQAIPKLLFYRNTGNPSSFEFLLDSASVAFEIPEPELAIVPTIADIDMDDDYDVIAGTASGNLYIQRNIGSLASPVFINDGLLETDIQFTNNVAPALFDINVAGRIDLLIGEQDGNISLFNNNGSAAIPFFAFYTDNYLYVDVGDNSTPCLTDIDGDNDFDLLVGETDGNLNFFRNTGSAGSPQFELEAFPDYRVARNSTPAVADINADGMPDLFLGSNLGNISLFNENGNGSDSDAMHILAEQLQIKQFGEQSVPALFDIDDDADLDLVVGSNNGKIHFMRNTGSIDSPRLVEEQTLLGLQRLGEFAKPAFTDLDRDGNTDMCVGQAEGTVRYFMKTGTANSVFLFDDSMLNGIKVKKYSAPAFADIDQDGDDDLFIGEANGGLLFYRNLSR